MTTPSFTNRLIHESSPYLKQHAHNPVDWYPWGSEALQRARELDRPIFLSIGYSACHWCHVMEHESFENPEIGLILNEHFVSIKVDREERPDLDQIYMAVVQILTRSGGWPMTVFLTPELKPFWGGTYFPPDDRYGRPGFQKIILALADAWTNRRQEIVNSAGDITTHLQEAIRFEPAPGDPNENLLRPVTRMLGRIFDSTHGGFGQAPKFPHAVDLRLLMRVWKRFGDDTALNMVKKTLDKMALGGIYDHLGGGFARYSTDARWLVPHFEKMLYDNALLTQTYIEAFQATGEAFYREVVEETLGYVLREMTSPEGPFYSTQDADSEGVEGKFYVWTREEIEQILGEELAATFCEVHGVTAEGNWQDPHDHGGGPKNILHRTRTWPTEAKMLRMAESDLRQKMDAARRQLYEARSRRIWPSRDEKVLTAWNGMMISSFALAAQVLDKPEYAQAASRAAEFLLSRLRTTDGQLLRTWSRDSVPKLNAYLEDYAFLIDSLVSLYETTFEPRWLESALQLAEVMIDQFWDANEGGFFFTGRDHEQLIARGKDPHDNATPSGNAVAVVGLLRLAKLTGRADLRDRAVTTMKLFHGLMTENPMATAQMLIAVDFHLGPTLEFAVIGDLQAPETQEVLRTIRNGFRPAKVVAVMDKPNPRLEELVPLLAKKTQLGEVTTYICRDYACETPLIGIDSVRQQLP
jgi:hypothetical protein